MKSVIWAALSSKRQACEEKVSAPWQSLRFWGLTAGMACCILYGGQMSDARPRMHDEKVSVRVSAELKHRATEAARRQGMSLSEAIRAFLRELARETENGR